MMIFCNHSKNDFISILERQLHKYDKEVAKRLDAKQEFRTALLHNCLIAKKYPHPGVFFSYSTIMQQPRFAL